MLVYCKGGSCGRVYYFDAGSRAWRPGEDFAWKRVPADIGGRCDDACFRLCFALDERAYSTDREQAAEAAENKPHGQHGCCCTGGGQADKKGGSVMFKWQVSSNYIGGETVYEVWRQTRESEPGEPMHSGLREVKFCFQSETEAQNCADELNK